MRQTSCVEKLIKAVQGNAPLKYRVLIAGYLLVLLAIGLGLMLGEAASVAPYVLGLVGLCIAVSLAMFAAHHVSLAMENRRLHSEGLRLDVKAHSDPLTDLMNRVAFQNVLEQQRDGGVATDIAILYFDLNRFKEVNDNLGHKVGDALLSEFARCLASSMPEAIAIARMGGDEFAAVLPADAIPEICAEAIGECLRQPLLVEGHLVQSGASIGIAYGNLIYDDADDLLRRADLAMYAAKGAGANTYRVFDDVMAERLSTRVNIRAELAHALENDELSLSYQPLVSARDGRLKSVEALLRWRSPRLGNVSPATLIPIAEESGQIIELSEWVINTALKAAQVLKDVPIGINISPVHFRQPGFARQLTDKLLAAGVLPELIYIEITEGVLIANMEPAKRAISQLRSLGVRVYLDDFGTGYSSLSYLQNFDFDGMKIDKSFLRDLGQRQQATQIMRSVIDLGHSLNLQVVAEGIESEWQARLLQMLNCDVLQGFHFAAPMSLEDVVRFRVDQDEALAADEIEAQPSGSVDSLDLRRTA